MLHTVLYSNNPVNKTLPDANKYWEVTAIIQIFQGENKTKTPKEGKNENWINLFSYYTVYVQRLFLFCRVALMFFPYRNSCWTTSKLCCPTLRKGMMLSFAMACRSRGAPVRDCRPAPTVEKKEPITMTHGDGQARVPTTKFFLTASPNLQVQADWINI